MTKVMDFSQVIPPDYLKRLATAYENHKLGILFVVSQEVLQKLNANQVYLLDGEEGSCFILVPQALIEEFYP